jgi:hypothetical protein
MKNTRIGHVESHGSLGQFGVKCMPLTDVPPIGAIIEIFWEGPEPKRKHNCRKVPQGYWVVRENAFAGPPWLLGRYDDVRDVWTYNAIVACPFCGEKLE